MHLASRLLTGALLLAAPAAFAQSSFSLSTASASATILKGISLANTTPMAFGNIVTSSTAGTVLMNPAGNLTPSGGVTTASGITPTAAAFDVTGAPNRTFTISLPSAAVTLTGPASATMTVSGFTASATSGTLSVGGSASFTVGGTLNVGANQTVGDYTGAYTVTVAYN